MSTHSHDEAHNLAHRAEVNEYFEQVVKLLAQLYAYNVTCTNVERRELDDDQLQCVADTMTELFNTQAAEPDTDCPWLSDEIVVTMNGLEKIVQEILDDFGIIKASIQRFEAIQRTDPEKYSRLLDVIGVDSALLHSHVEFLKVDEKGQQSSTFFLHSPYLEPLEVFKELTRFSKISDRHIAELRRGVYEVLGWQLEIDSSTESIEE